MPNRSRLQGSDPLPPPHMGGDRRRRLSGEDLISGLPDEVLHGILVRLRSARAAARTSVLSRRWRHVWAHMPEILLDIGLEAPPAPAPASFLDTVDGAIAGCLAPTLERLSISLSADCDFRVPAGRVAPWLRFAAERVAGELCLFVPSRFALPLPHVGHEVELELPACGRAQTITLFPQVGWRLRLQLAGLFTALTALRILCGRMEGSELSTLVCTQCPRLSDLRLSVTLVAVANVSIRSDSLHSLRFRAMNTQRLEVVAPRLEELTLDHTIQVHVSAPKLAKLVWRGGANDPCNHLFPDVGRRLCLLEIGLYSVGASLMRQFDVVDVLKLAFCIQQGIVGYQSFLNGTKKLPKCKALSISLLWIHHGLAPVILHLLRSCNSTRKFSLLLFHSSHSSRNTCSSSCPCCLEEGRRIDDIDLGSLDEVEISSFKISHEELEIVELLSRCKATVLKKLVINYKTASTSPETKEICEKVRNTCRPNVAVEFYVFPDGPGGRRVRFD